MKLIKYRILLIIIVIFGLLSNRTGRNEGSTGAPNETDNVTCANCHIRGPFKPGISVELLANNSKVAVIKANTDYTVNILLTDSTAKASVYGFQLVPLNSANAMAGSFPVLGTRVKRVNDIGRTYLSHSARSVTSLFTATWRSPATISSTDSIKFYFSGVTGNDDGGSIGDNAVLGTRTFYPEGSVTSSEEFDLILPTLVHNIASEILHFSNFETVKRIKIFDASGRIILSEYLNGKNYADISTLGSGYFYIQFITDKNPVTRKFLKI